MPRDVGALGSHRRTVEGAGTKHYQSNTESLPNKCLKFTTKKRPTASLVPFARTAAFTSNNTGNLI
jgi:hypothetical protein